MLTIETKAEFDKIVEMIKENVELYENYLCNIKYTLFLASGTNINIKYDISNVPHLLGLNLDYLRMLNCYSAKNSYELLQAFIKDSFSAYKKANNVTSIFSEYVIDKNIIFSNNLKINLENIVAVVEYKKERVYGISEIEKPCDCYLIQRTPKKDAYIMLGFAKNENNYVPQTSQILDLTIEKDQENLKNILYKQSITFCSGLRYQNGYSVPQNFSLYPNNKAEVMTKLKKFAEKFDSEISVANDYSYLLKHLGEVKSNSKSQKENLHIISSKIAAGVIVDIDLFEDLDEELIEIINSYNNSLTKDSSENSFLYSDLSQSYRELKALTDLLQKENMELKMENTEKEQRISELEQENTELKELKQKMITLLQ